MRVLSMTTVFPNSKQPNHGVFVRERLRYLARHVDITVVAPVPYFPIATGRMASRPAGVEPTGNEAGLEVLHPRFWSSPGLFKSIDGILYATSVWPTVRELHRRQPFDLIDAHFAYPDGYAAVTVGARLGIPVSITLRGTLPDLARRPSRRWALRRTLRRADVILSVSESLKQDAVALGIDPARIHVVANGIDTETFHPGDRQAARAHLGLPRGDRVVLTVGALREVKGHHHLLPAIARVRERIPDVRLVVVGGASISDDRSVMLREMAERLGIADRVLWAGARPHEEIPIWLAAADLFVNASRREGCCNALLEAQASGRPAVATAVGGNPEIVSSPDLGALAPPGDANALAKAIEQALERDWSAERIRAAVADRGWDGTARSVMRAWEASLGARRLADRLPRGGVAAPPGQVPR